MAFSALMIPGVGVISIWDGFRSGFTFLQFFVRFVLIFTVYKIIPCSFSTGSMDMYAIRVIFDRYVNTDIGANGLSKYLENHGIHKISRQNGKNPLFEAGLIRIIIKNPVCCGKIAYGRRKTEKVTGSYKLKTEGI